MLSVCFTGAPNGVRLELAVDATSASTVRGEVASVVGVNMHRARECKMLSNCAPSTRSESSGKEQARAAELANVAKSTL